MPRRQYRRNGTPIGDHKVYALAMRGYTCTDVFEIEPSGIETYEGLEVLVDLEKMSGKFGFNYDRLVITKPGANLVGADIYGIDIRGANLEGSDIRFSNLAGSELEGAKLAHSNLVGSILYGANFRGSDLRDADLYECDIDKAIFSGCIWDRTTKWPAGFRPHTSTR